MEQGEKKNFFFEVGVLKQGDVLKQMFQKGYKISFRMYLNLCNTRIDVEKRVYKEVILSLHFSIASFNMQLINFYMSYCLSQQGPCTKPFIGSAY